MSNSKLLMLGLLLLGFVFLADFYSGVQEQKRAQQAALEQEKREQEQRAHEQRMQELEEQNRQREDLLRREAEQMQQRQEMIDQAKAMGEKALRGAKLSQGLQMAGLFKMTISEFYQSRGRLPASNNEVGLESPEAYASGALAAAEVRSGGVITLIYNAESGVDGGEIYLLPEARAYGLGWSCETPDYRHIKQLINSCEFELGRH